MKKPTPLKQLEEYVDFIGKGLVKLNIKVDHDMIHLLSKTMQHYFELPIMVQLLVKMSNSMSGKMVIKRGKYRGFVFQMSHGVQQIKKYEPEKYRNDRNTPLRLRTRTIVHLASLDPVPNLQTKGKELFRSYPYYLLKTEPVKLRMKNFYFDPEVLPGRVLRIYKAEDPENPDPESDILYAEEEYSPKKTIRFEYGEEDIQQFYAMNTGNGRVSGLLKFIWAESIPGLE
jgi:hypothetical protein